LQPTSPSMEAADIFILQLEGSKEWRFHSSPKVLNAYEGIELDHCGAAISRLKLSNPKDSPDYDLQHACAHKRLAIEKKVLLHAGDVLYIPRGVIYDSKALNKRSSLDLAIRIEVERQGTWEHVLMRALSPKANLRQWLDLKQCDQIPAHLADAASRLAGATHPLSVRRALLPYRDPSKKIHVCDALLQMVGVSAASNRVDVLRAQGFWNHTLQEAIKGGQESQTVARHLHTCCTHKQFDLGNKLVAQLRAAKQEGMRHWRSKMKEGVTRHMDAAFSVYHSDL